MVVAVLVVGLLGSAAPAAADQAGVMDLTLNLYAAATGDYTAPIWMGTVDLGDGDVRGIAFFHLGSGKPYGEDHPTGTAAHFGEQWVLYADPGPIEALTATEPVFITAGEFAPGEMLMWGYDAGVGNFVSNSRYRMGGSVESVNPAFAEYAAWEGRTVHMAGTILYWEEGDLAGVPRCSPGTFRINGAPARAPFAESRSTASSQHQAL